jgi:hypothetical protein
MDYTIQVLQKCKAYGFKVFMDPHQDTVSLNLNNASIRYMLILFSGLVSPGGQVLHTGLS